MPLEASLGQRFRSNIFKLYPHSFYHKLPDTAGIGGMRPFDAVAIIMGVTFVIEFKRGSKTQATPYQRYNLDLAQANGAVALVVNEQNQAQTLKAMEVRINGR